MARGWLTLLACLTFAAPAGASWRGSVTDKQDQRGSLDGPDQPDIQRATARYDPAEGRITLRLTFWGPFYKEGGDSADQTVVWRLGKWTRHGCGYTKHSPSGFDTSVEVDGYDGALTGHQWLSGDRLHMTTRVADPVLADRRYDCFAVELWADEISYAGDPDSRYDEECDCWTDSYVADGVRDGRLVRRSP